MFHQNNFVDDFASTTASYVDAEEFIPESELSAHLLFASRMPDPQFPPGLWQRFNAMLEDPGVYAPIAQWFCGPSTGKTPRQILRHLIVSLARFELSETVELHHIEDVLGMCMQQASRKASQRFASNSGAGMEQATTGCGAYPHGLSSSLGSTAAPSKKKKGSSQKDICRSFLARASQQQRLLGAQGVLPVQEAEKLYRSLVAFLPGALPFHEMLDKMNSEGLVLRVAGGLKVL